MTIPPRSADSTTTFGPDRRTVLKGAATLGAAGALAARGAAQSSGAGDAELRIALVGCGGRGTGAAVQALNAAGNARLVAMADAFGDRLAGSLDHISKQHEGKVDVPKERQFVGFDAFQRAIDTDVDVVILATPPGFRPAHFDYAVSKGRHVFMEKPVAVDGPGVRKVFAAAARAKEAGLKVGVGLQRHHSAKYTETIERLRAGEFGQALVSRVYWNSAGVWVVDRKLEWSEMTYQMRNWYYFKWLCGDQIVEQHIHNLDVGNWIMDDHPVSCHGMGGREVRTGDRYGEIYDHFAIEYVYGDGRRMQSQCRHHPQTRQQVDEFAHTSEGILHVGGGRFTPHASSKTEAWRFRDEDPNHFQVEHDALFAAIRSGAEHVEADRGATATLTAIMGRMAAYSGKEVTWDQALRSERVLAPMEDLAALTFDTAPRSQPDAAGLYPIPVPGQFELG
ncbi:MAG: Gfo/Idh/MocA family oxidoreductase [Planctomycetota bacterium]